MIKNPRCDGEVLKELYGTLHKSYPIIDFNNMKLFCVGFHKELREATGLPTRMLSHFFKYYCNLRYRKLIKLGASRYNLKGECVSTVTEAQALYTKKTISEIIKRRKLRSAKAQKPPLVKER